MREKIKKIYKTKQWGFGYKSEINGIEKIEKREKRVVSKNRDQRNIIEKIKREKRKMFEDIQFIEARVIKKIRHKQKEKE